MAWCWRSAISAWCRRRSRPGSPLLVFATAAASIMLHQERAPGGAALGAASAGDCCPRPAAAEAMRRILRVFMSVPGLRPNGRSSPAWCSPPLAEGFGLASLLPALTILLGDGGEPTLVHQMVYGALDALGLPVNLEVLLLLVLVGRARQGGAGGARADPGRLRGRRGRDRSAHHRGGTPARRSNGATSPASRSAASPMR